MPPWRVTTASAVERFVVPLITAMYTGYEYVMPFFPHVEPLSPPGLFLHYQLLDIMFRWLFIIEPPVAEDYSH
jgi:hypothetical protein